MIKEKETQRKTGREMRNRNIQHKSFQKLSCVTKTCSIFSL